MDRWIALGTFLLGAGVGALTTAAVHAMQIRKLKELLEATTNNSRKTKEQRPQSNGGKST